MRDARWGRLPVAALLLALVSGCASYASCRSAACADDSRLGADVYTALSNDKEILPGSIVARVHDRVVYLYGLAETDTERQNAESIARAVPGIARVVSFVSINNR